MNEYIKEEMASAWQSVFHFATQNYPTLYTKIMYEEELTPVETMCRLYEVLENGFVEEEL